MSIASSVKESSIRLLQGVVFFYVLFLLAVVLPLLLPSSSGLYTVLPKLWQKTFLQHNAKIFVRVMKLSTISARMGFVLETTSKLFKTWLLEVSVAVGLYSTLPLLEKYVYFRVPPWLQELWSWLPGTDSRAEDDEDEDDDSEPPPLEDITTLSSQDSKGTGEIGQQQGGDVKEKQKEWMVYDPVVGVVSAELRDSWLQQEEERNELFERLSYIHRLKTLPPVRYSTESVETGSVLAGNNSISNSGGSSGRLRVRTRSGSADLASSTGTGTGSSRGRSRGKSEHVLDEEISTNNNEEELKKKAK